MNSLNSSSVDVGEVEAVGPGVGSGASVGASEPRDKELSEPASLGVTLTCVVPPVRAVGGLAWSLGVVEICWGCFRRGGIAKDGEKLW